WASGWDTRVESRVRPGVDDRDWWERSLREAGHALPVQAAALATTPERAVPVPGRLEPEAVDRLAVAGHGVVGEVPAHHACEPLPLFGDGQMPASHQLGLDLAQLCLQPLRLGDAFELKAPVAGLPADVREAQERERLRLAEAPLLSSLGGEPSELEQARLLGGQLQAESRKSVAKLGEEPLGLIPVLEADDVVVGKAHDD